MKSEDKYTPLGDIVIIRADQPRSETASGIVIKEDWKALPPKGEIIAMGGKCKELEFQIGDRVVFERYSAITLEDDLRLCKASQVLAIENA